MVNGECDLRNPLKKDDPTILDRSMPPQKQPHLWCYWEPAGDGESYIWRNGEKSYAYNEWLKYSSFFV
ncbi:MAG: hypothetical protein KAI83_11925 [Thiomargarita sp.]|nr:hypothetical protein [Thiomargarita sp.]